jgi:hypothetical protein
MKTTAKESAIEGGFSTDIFALTLRAAGPSPLRSEVPSALRFRAKISGRTAEKPPTKLDYKNQTIYLTRSLFFMA